MADFNIYFAEKKLTPQEFQNLAFPTTVENNRRIAKSGGADLLKNINNYSVNAVRSMPNIHRYESPTSLRCSSFRCSR